MSTYSVFADEAWTHDSGLRFWRFYGGAMMLSSRREMIERELAALKEGLGLQGEMKWSKTRPFQWERFATVIDRFFDYVEAGDIKLRYMWLDQLFQNPAALNEYHREYGYYILYYYFIVFAFGLPWHGESSVRVEAFLDTLPAEPEKRQDFRQFMLSCHQSRRFANRSRFQIFDVGDVDSRDHVILQCVDLIIGAIGFRLNKMHQAKKANGRRAEATKVKERLYKRIYERLREIDTGERGRKAFGPGVNTGRGSNFANLWSHKFRQWSFRKPGTVNPDWIRD